MQILLFIWRELSKDASNRRKYENTFPQLPIVSSKQVMRLFQKITAWLFIDFGHIDLLNHMDVIKVCCFKQQHPLPPFTPFFQLTWSNPNTVLKPQFERLCISVIHVMVSYFLILSPWPSPPFVLWSFSVQHDPQLRCETMNCVIVCALLFQNSFNWSVDYVFQVETFHVSYITMSNY